MVATESCGDDWYCTLVMIVNRLSREQDSFSTHENVENGYLHTLQIKKLFVCGIDTLYAVRTVAKEKELKGVS
jgi:hypothetical protein